MSAESRLPFSVLLVDRIDRQVVAAHERLALLLRIVLAQRIADELLVQEDAAQVGVTVEADAVHVERLALLPVERRPQLDERRHARVLLGHRDLEAHAVAVLERAQLVADLEARLVSFQCALGGTPTGVQSSDRSR